jgi:hypothetical protein
MTNQALMYQKAKAINPQLRLTFFFIVQLIIDGGGQADDADVMMDPDAGQMKAIFEVKDGKWSMDWYIKNGSKQFAKPTLKEVTDYFSATVLPAEGSKFFNFYESKGWMVGKNKMKDWKAAARNWLKTSEEKLKSNDTNGKLTSRISRQDAADLLNSVVTKRS